MSTSNNPNRNSGPNRLSFSSEQYTQVKILIALRSTYTHLHIKPLFSSLKIVAISKIMRRQQA